MKIEDDKYDRTSIKAIARGNLKTLKQEITSSLGRQQSRASRFHLDDLVERIDQILDPK